VSEKTRGGRLAAIYFLFMIGCYLAVSAMSPRLRPQMASIHSLFWTFAMPWVAACCAVLSAAVWFTVHLLAKRYQAKAR
jgi:hypothetical protein